MRLRASGAAACLTLAMMAPLPALAQEQASIEGLRAEIAQQKAELEAQRAQIAAQQRRLDALESRLTGMAPPPGTAVASGGTPAAPAPGKSAPARTASSAGVQQVGEAPKEKERAPEVAVLGDQGGIVSTRGRLTTEFGLEYTRADRIRALFAGVRLDQVIAIGVFNISESRQNSLQASTAFRYGLSDKFEIGARLPFSYRTDEVEINPISGDDSANSQARAAVQKASGRSIGDVDVSARYQITGGRGGWPFLIANLGVSIPTGSDPFAVPRDSDGRPLESATGSGFFGVSPSVTAIVQTDPAVLFGTLGYSHNFARKDLGAVIASRRILSVTPGDSFSFSGGIGISLNQRTSLNLGYAHTFALGTQTTSVLAEPKEGQANPEVTTTSRNLQLGRLLFGVTYRMSNRSSLNWSVEVGATEDATDLRTTLRIPFTLLTGSK